MSVTGLDPWLAEKNSDNKIFGGQLSTFEYGFWG